MTEFAFSGLGMNPHYGTPSNPYDRAGKRIPGGSSSGAAVSVTDGMAHAAIGSDTGGSVRIPAALCGLTGFKPTARRIPLDGALPLSSHARLRRFPGAHGCLLRTHRCGFGRARSATATAYRHQSSAFCRAARLCAGRARCVRQRRPFLPHWRFSRVVERSLEDVTFASLDKIPIANQKGGFAAAEGIYLASLAAGNAPDRATTRASPHAFCGGKR